LKRGRGKRKFGVTEKRACALKVMERGDLMTQAGRKGKKYTFIARGGEVCPGLLDPKVVNGKKAVSHAAVGENRKENPCT